ncbi:hypothetical protein EDD15DRAFT_2193803 [Pisolithus albus]|nr:hypothetical protein EDD15DRAFT_2193803 [Pisolithus albus]
MWMRTDHWPSAVLRIVRLLTCNALHPSFTALPNDGLRTASWSDAPELFGAQVGNHNLLANASKCGDVGGYAAPTDVGIQATQLSNSPIQNNSETHHNPEGNGARVVGVCPIIPVEERHSVKGTGRGRDRVAVECVAGIGGFQESRLRDPTAGISSVVQSGPDQALPRKAEQIIAEIRYPGGAGGYRQTDRTSYHTQGAMPETEVVQR